MFVIYTSGNCPFCLQVEQIMQSRGWKYEKKSVHEKKIREELKALNPNINTVPQIFLDEVHIGGYNELVESIETQTLRTLMEQKNLSFVGTLT